jgi:hypothetical protein
LLLYPISGTIHDAPQTGIEKPPLGRLGEEGPVGNAPTGQAEDGLASYLAQAGQRHPAAKALKGFGSAGVLEVVEDFRGDAYRAVYTVRFARAV